MIRRCYDYALVYFLLASVALADFVGFPLSGSTNAGSWYEATDLYDPFGQIYSGVVERCVITGVSEPNVVETWPATWGTNITIVTNAYGVFTNISVVTTNIVTTNALGPFTYTGQGGATMTGTPYVTHAFVAAMDTAIGSLIPHFAATNWATGGNFNDYFALEDAATNRPTEFPLWNFAAMCDTLSIGYATNLATNVWGVITNGNGYWTRQPEYKAHWVLAEAHWTGAWNYIEIDDMDTRLYDATIRPVIQYQAGGTNALGSLSVTLTGSNLVWSDQSLVATTEVVSVTSSNTALTERWYRVQGISVGSAAPNTNDTLSVVWTNRIALYGDLPYRLHAEDIDERVVALEAMVWTTQACTWATSTNSGQATPVQKTPWSAATSWVETNWPDWDITASAGAQVWTRGRTSGGGFDAQAESHSNQVYLSAAVNTNYSHTVEFYAKATMPPLWASIPETGFDGQGWDLVLNTYHAWTSSASVVDGVVTSPAIGMTNIGTWCAEPTDSTGLVYGFTFSGADSDNKSLIKWDGFDYK